MTPEGPGKVRQVHVLASSVTVQVEGPNETRLMVEVLVPEPVFDDAPLTDRARSAQGSKRDAEMASDDAGDLPGDDEAQDTGDVRAGGPDAGAARRPSRSRSRKRPA
jgi:hypothetical protein